MHFMNEVLDAMNDGNGVYEHYHLRIVTGVSFYIYLVIKRMINYMISKVKCPLTERVNRI